MRIHSTTVTVIATEVSMLPTPQHPIPPAKNPENVRLSGLQLTEAGLPVNEQAPAPSTNICQVVPTHDNRTVTGEPHIVPVPSHIAPVDAVNATLTGIPAHPGQSTHTSAKIVVGIGLLQQLVFTPPQNPPHHDGFNPTTYSFPSVALNVHDGFGEGQLPG